MNALIKKEIRLLLPHWIAALLVAIVPPELKVDSSIRPDRSPLFEYMKDGGTSDD